MSAALAMWRDCTARPPAQTRGGRTSPSARASEGEAAVHREERAGAGGGLRPEQEEDDAPIGLCQTLRARVPP